MVFYIADTHFGDENILTYEHRPFKSVEEMNNVMIEKWNHTVASDDTVWLLGDIGDLEYLQDLKGKIKIVIGNHDNYEELQLKLGSRMEVYKYSIVDDFTILSHKPLEFIPAEMPYLNIHGHLHSFSYTRVNTDLTWRSGRRHFCCSVEQTDYMPISYARIKEILHI